MVCLSLWSGGLVSVLLRAESSFRNGDPYRQLVAVIDTKWAQDKLLLPSAFLYALFATIYVVMEGDFSPAILVTILVVYLALITTSVAFLDREAKQINRVQRVEGVSEPSVLRRERRYLLLLRMQATGSVVLVFLNSLIIGR